MDSAVGTGSTFTVTIPQVNELRRAANENSNIL
jgi:hypothetical protein